MGNKSALDLDQFSSNAQQAAALLKAMSNEHRLMVLCTLLDSEMSVSEINDVVPLSQSALSQHLAALRKADLVETRRESQTIYYRVSNAAVLQIITVLKNTFCP